MKKITQLLLLLSLVSCSTGYHKQSFSGGYTDTQLAETIYKVRFNGNGYTSLPRLQSFLLRRYAELTIEKGYDYFLELSADDLSDYSIGSSWDNESINVTTRHSTSGVIKLYKAGEEPSNAYDPYLILKKKRTNSSEQSSLKSKSLNRLHTDKTSELKKSAPLLKKTYLGLAYYSNNLGESSGDGSLDGGALRAGLTVTQDKVRFKVGGLYLFSKLSDEGKSETLRDLKYDAIGLEGSLEYTISESFGLGPYGSISIGNYEKCISTNSCTSSSVSALELGLRVDWHMKYWNPYFAIGYTGVMRDEDSPDVQYFGGASAYLGLLNFEF